MAIVNDQLYLGVAIRYPFIDPLTSAPVVGRVFFFETDKVTLKNIYIQSGDPQNPFIVAPNPIDLGTDGGFVVNGTPVILYYYPFDETDNATPQLYYVEVRRTDTSLVYSFDDFPENFVPDTPITESSDLQNLFPSYGFDLPVFKDFFTEANQQRVTSTQSRVAAGWTFAIGDPGNSEFYYEYDTIDSGVIEGNPLYLLTLKEVNAGADQSTLGLWSVIAVDNTRFEEEIHLQFFAEDKSSTAVTSLDIGLTLSTDITTFINVGNISLDTSLSKRELSFTFPDLSGVLTEDNTFIFLQIRQPLDQAFEISYTGMFIYSGEIVSDLIIVPQNVGTQDVTQRFNDVDTDLHATDKDFLSSGLALTYKKGTISFLNSTGQIFPAPTKEQYDFAVLMDGRTIVNNQPLLSTLTNRFLENSDISHLAGNAFIVNPITSTSFDIETLSPAPSFSPWVSSSGAITIVHTNGVGIPELSSIIDGGNPALLHITFTTAYLANMISAYYQVTNIYTANSSQPATNVINSWYGNIGGNPVTLSFTPATFLSLTTTNPGNGGVATIDIEFTAAPSIADINSTIQPLFDLRFYKNYFSFIPSNPGNAVTTMPVPPPIVISTSVDGTGQSIPGSNHQYILQLDSTLISSTSYLATQLNNLINISDDYTITVNSLPANGVTLQVSTSDTDIVIIFHDTGQSKPSNPFPSRLPLFLEFTTSDTLDTFTTNLINLFRNEIGGIPTPGNLTADSVSLPDLPSNLRYYIYV